MASPGGYVYAIGAEGSPFVKIGCTKSVEQRLRTLQTNHPLPLSVRAAVPVHNNMHRLEKQVHAFLQEEHRRGEWFEIEMDTVKLEALIVRAIAHITRGKRRIPREGLPKAITIGQRIAELRRQRDLSQYALAKAARIAYSTVHMIESGKRPGAGMTLATAIRLAHALGVTVDALVAGTDEDEEEAA